MTNDNNKAREAAQAHQDPLVSQAVLDDVLRDDLGAFIFRVFQTLNPGTPYKHNWHIDAIVYELMRCAHGENQRLLINQPPRSLKSICVSVAFVAWVLGNDPSKKFICLSYSAELATDLARMFRAVIGADWFKRVFPRFEVAKDKELECVTTEGGVRYATSVGGTLTGRGADIIIIDDPMKAGDAHSKTKRDTVLQWYRDTLVTRLDDKTKGVLLVVMQRLHQEDLAGYLLEQGGWAHLCLSAIAEEDEVVKIGPDEVHRRKAGEVLHPEHEPLSALNQTKVEISSFTFTAQYQQRPVPAEGNLIKWGWFQWYDHPPAQDRGWIVQSWDTASKIGNNNDYSVCTTWLVQEPRFYLLDVVRERLEYPDLKRRVVELARRWGATRVLIEDKGPGTALIQDLRHEGSRVKAIEIEPEKDKLTRMETEAAHIEAQHVFLPKSASWLEDFKVELLAFPAGKHDDQVDSVSQVLGYCRDFWRHRLRSGRVMGW